MAFGLDLLVSLVGVLILAQHTWALRGHFVSDRTTGGANLILIAAGVSCLLMLGLTWLLEQPIVPPLAGLACMGLSLAVFWSAVKASRQARLRYAFDNALPSSVVTAGPYKYIRHPFYTAYMAFWFAWAIAVWSIWALVPAATMAALYLIAARFEEKLLSSSGLSSAYVQYKSQTGMFWPAFRTGKRG